ncbi:MAG TPA: four helix bundle protein, partial [Thermomicrobiales bacterium]|nr:four helix bundle protein [Thermomicrobiales bacterium]
MGKQHYQDLIVWRKAMALVLDIYRVSKRWPADEVYGLTGQVRRAAVSIPANVAEGQGRTGSKEFLHHLSIANGSLYEVETHLILARDLSYLDEQVCDTLLRQAAEIGRLLNGLIRSLRAAGYRLAIVSNWS